jgi:hypothetical protein
MPLVSPSYRECIKAVDEKRDIGILRVGNIIGLCNDLIIKDPNVIIDGNFFVCNGDVVTDTIRACQTNIVIEDDTIFEQNVFIDNTLFVCNIAPNGRDCNTISFCGGPLAVNTLTACPNTNTITIRNNVIVQDNLTVQDNIFVCNIRAISGQCNSVTFPSNIIAQDNVTVQDTLFVCNIAPIGGNCTSIAFCNGPIAIEQIDNCPGSSNVIVNTNLVIRTPNMLQVDFIAPADNRTNVTFNPTLTENVVICNPTELAVDTVKGCSANSAMVAPPQSSITAFATSFINDVQIGSNTAPFSGDFNQTIFSANPINFLPLNGFARHTEQSVSSGGWFTRNRILVPADVWTHINPVTGETPIGIRSGYEGNQLTGANPYWSNVETAWAEGTTFQIFPQNFTGTVNDNRIFALLNGILPGGGTLDPFEIFQGGVLINAATANNVPWMLTRWVNYKINLTWVEPAGNVSDTDTVAARLLFYKVEGTPTGAASVQRFFGPTWSTNARALVKGATTRGRVESHVHFDNITNFPVSAANATYVSSVNGAAQGTWAVQLQAWSTFETNINTAASPADDDETGIFFNLWN